MSARQCFPNFYEPGDISTCARWINGIREALAFARDAHNPLSRPKSVTFNEQHQVDL